MRIIVLVGAIILLIIVSAAGNDFLELADEIRLPLPGGWQLGSDTGNFPYQLIHVDPVAELIVFRSYIASGMRVRDEEDLKRSVEFVVEEILTDIPGAKLLTSSGFSEIFRAGFVVEFLSPDSASNTELRHRLQAHIYRLPDGRQVMYTLWAKCAVTQYAGMAGGMEHIQSDFCYIGPYEAEVFAFEWYSPWFLLLIPFLLVGLLKVLRRPSQPTPTSRVRQKVATK